MALGHYEQNRIEEQKVRCSLGTGQRPQVFQCVKLFLTIAIVPKSI